jgi:hypothetical protein
VGMNPGQRMTESQFQATVIDMAQRGGWLVAHFRPAQNARGDWRTPVAGDGKGFPDLVLVHHGRGLLLFRELKTQTGRLSGEQVDWLNALRAAGQNVKVWRPSDFPAIEALLLGSPIRHRRVRG